MPVMGFTTVRVNVGALIIDGIDDDDIYDDVPVSGKLLLEPMIEPGRPVQVADGGRMKIKAIAPFPVDIGLNGEISYRNKDFVTVPAPTSATSNVAQLQWRATFQDLKYGTTKVTVPPIYFWAEPGLQVDLGDHINIAPNPTAVQLSRGARGFGVVGAVPVEDEPVASFAIEYETASGTALSDPIPLPEGSGGGLTEQEADTRYAPLWQASEVVTAGTIRVSPTGLPISRIANGTTRPAYDATEIALWTPVAATPAQLTPKLDKTEAATTYTPQAAVGYGTKKAFFNCGNTVDTIANTTGAVFRVPVKVPVLTSRWRVHWQNRFGKTRTSQTGVVNVLGFVFGDELMNADGSHSGQFTAAPASVGAAGTTTDGSEYVGAWVTDPALQLKPYADHLVSYGLTCASGVVMCRSSNIVQYRNGASQAPQFNQQTIVPNSTATSFGEMWIEYEFVGANSVGLYVGDSLTDGTKNLLGQIGNYPNAHALRDAVCPIVLGNSGIKVDDYMNIPTTDYVYTKWGLGAGVVPDYAVVMAGINDIIFLGFTDVEIQNKLVAFWNRLRAFGIKRIYAITLPPAGATGAVETQRLNVNAWLRGKPAGLAGVFDGDRALKDATTAANLDATYNSGDGLHYSVAGYQKLADTIPALK